MASTAIAIDWTRYPDIVEGALDAWHAYFSMTYINTLYRGNECSGSIVLNQTSCSTRHK